MLHLHHFLLLCIRTDQDRSILKRTEIYNKAYVSVCGGGRQATPFHVERRVKNRIYINEKFKARAPEIRLPSRHRRHIFKLATIVSSRIIQAFEIIYAIKLIPNAVL